MVDKTIAQQKELTLRIGLNSDGLPVHIDWQAEQEETPKPCKAMLLSVFDETHRDTYKIDLWTTEMQVIEMDRLMYQTLRSLADTYFKATGNNELASQMQQFAQYFGEKTQIFPPSEG